MNKIFYLSLVAVLATAFNVMALDHGSIVGAEGPLYSRYGTGTPGTALATKKIDFKIVTVNSKMWIWTNLIGGTIFDQAWASHLRYRTPNYCGSNACEDNLTGRIGASQTFGMGAAAKIPTQNAFKFSIYQAESGAVATDAYETAVYDYDKTKQNSKNASDTDAPDWVTCKYENLTDTKVDLVFSVTEGSGQYFYYIKDAANGIEEVLFVDKYELTGLKPKTEYNITVTAIDFSGNESEPKLLEFGAEEAVSINSGIAKGLYFQLGSTANELTVYARPVDAAAALVGAQIKYIEYGKGDVTEVSPEVPEENNWGGVPSYTYKIPHSFPLGTLVEINLGYLLGPIVPPITDEDWSLVYETYVYINRYVTEGEFTGKAIVHIIGESGLSGISGTNVDSPISFTQSEGLIIINAEAATTAQLYAIGGQLIANTTAKTINTSALAKGIYILKVKDAVGNTAAFKIIVK